MAELSKKRCKLEVHFIGANQTTDVEVDNCIVNFELEHLQEHLLQNCLCNLPSNILQKINWWFHSKDTSWSELTTNWSRDRVLLLITSMQLIYEVSLKQYAEGKVCQRLMKVRHILTRRVSRLMEFLMTFADCPDPFISFAASRTLVSFFLVVGRHANPLWLDNLTINILTYEEPSKICFSLDVLKRIVDWKNLDGYTLKDNNIEERISAAACPTLSVSFDQLSYAEMKCTCVQSLGREWHHITAIFQEMIRTNLPQYHCSITAFLNLWCSIVSVKANLSVIDTEPFYANLNSYVDLLSNKMPSVYWNHILKLFNEVLCYGSTLSLQGLLDEKSCDLATKIVRNVKDRQLLDMVPLREDYSGFAGGECGKGGRLLLRKVALLIFKATAVTVKAVKYDSSSDSSSGSGVDVTDPDMVVIERSIRDVIQKLDDFMKRCMEYQPVITVAEWIVRFFEEQDDYLIESMICCLDVTQSICYRKDAFPAVHVMLNPYKTFLEFLDQVPNPKENYLINLLISNETNFLLYLLRMLKFIIRNFNEFLETCCNRHIPNAVHTLLIRLRNRLQEQIRKNLFPYNITPLIRRLVQFEEICTRNSKLSLDNYDQYV